MANSLTVYGRPCHFRTSTYNSNGRLALILAFDDYFDDVVISVNLVDEDCPEGCAFIDDNNCPYAQGLLLDNNIGSPIGIGFSGYCIYPLYKINFDILRRFMQ